MVPAEKMKIKGELEPKPHLVPLSDQAIEIIQSMPRTDKYVFPSDHAEEHQPFRAERACWGHRAHCRQIHHARLPHELPKLGR